MRTTTGGELLVVGIATGQSNEVCQPVEHTQLVVRDALFAGAKQGTFGLQTIGSARSALRQRSEFAEEIVCCRGAWPKSAVVVTEAVEIRMGKGAALAAVGKGEAAERAGRVGAFARHSSKFTLSPLTPQVTDTAHRRGVRRGKNSAGEQSKPQEKGRKPSREKQAARKGARLRICSRRRCSWEKSTDDEACHSCRA
jgi:hypothetical protein